MSYDSATIAAYIDGELDLLTSKRLEASMREDAALADRIEAERSLKARLAARFNPVLHEEVPERLTTMLSQIDTSLDDRRVGRQKSRIAFHWQQWTAMAASLVAGVMIGQWNMPGIENPVATRNGYLVAQGALEKSLNTQLASAQPPNAAVRIGLTFRDNANIICRTFEFDAMGGVACRNQDQWQLRHMISNSEKSATEYRQAGSSEIAEAASAMMAGPALDAAGEAKSLRDGWK